VVHRLVKLKEISHRTGGKPIPPTRLGRDNDLRGGNIGRLAAKDRRRQRDC